MPGEPPRVQPSQEGRGALGRRGQPGRVVTAGTTRREPEPPLGGELAHVRGVPRLLPGHAASRSAGRCRSPSCAGPRLPSGWTPLELLDHVAHMEQRWFVWGFLGEPVADPWGDSQRRARPRPWQVPPDRGLDQVVGVPRRAGRADARRAGGATRRRTSRATTGRFAGAVAAGPALDLLPRAAGVRPARRPPRRRRRARRRPHGGVARPVVEREALRAR